MTENAPKYLTPAQVVERWDDAIKASTLANWRSRKVGPPFQKFGTRVRYPIDALVAWEAQNLHQVGANDNNGSNAGKAA